MANEILVVTGSLCLILALIEAWLLVALATNPAGGLSRWIADFGDLVKSHIDYLLMALFLFVFYLLFAQFQITAPAWLIGALGLGSLGNPALFLVRAMKPDLKTAPTGWFRGLMGGSCVLTTIGYVGGAWLITVAALERM
ncbi:MAG: hypothetical protein FIA97_19675 [Methylococcaceae bacterium]|nr:hypothetical protein [Methylococcaceae bacterium]